MINLIKPNALKKGDKVATVSLSWGGAGDQEYLWRYELGKKRLEEMGLIVVEMEHTLKGSEFLYQHPELRAKDLMDAFSDDSIKGIFSCIGGDESIRLLPYIDFNIIRNNPKVFIGYSDTTVNHFMCLKAGLSTFYGPSILAEFAENIEMFDYTKHWVQKVLFENDVIGEIEHSPIWTSDRIPWLETNKNKCKSVYEHTGIECIQGKGVVTGPLIGGCIEVLEMLKGTTLWPTIDIFENTILFLETSEDQPTPTYLEYWLRNYGSQGILHKINGIMFGKPYHNEYYEEYKQVINKVIVKELNLTELPIFYNMNFGHTNPMMVLPYGALAQMDCEQVTFSILESGVK